MRTVLAVAVAVWGSVAPPAYAADDAERLAGSLCGYMTTNDPSGAVESDPHWQYGTMDGGPITVRPDDSGELPQSVALTCSIQVGDRWPSGVDAVAVTGAGTATAYFPPSGISYRAAPGDNVYVCARVEWTTRYGRYALDWDYDSSEAGAQCCLVWCEQPFPYLGEWW